MRSMPARTCLVATLLALAATAGGQWVEDSIDVGGRWVGSLAYNSREDAVYGRSQSEGLFFTISCASNRVIRSLSFVQPSYIAFDSIDNKAYCTSSSRDTVLVISGLTHLPIGGISLDYAKMPVWDPVSNRLYVSCGDDNEVAAIDCTTDSVIARIGVGRDPIRMYLNTRHRKLYVLNHDGESISIVDLESLEVVETIRLGFVPEAGCYSAAEDKYYCGAGSEVVVVDGAGDSVLAVIDLPAYMTVKSAVAVESVSLVMVGTGCPTAVDTLYVVDAVADTLVAAHAAGGTPEALHWSPASGVVYAAVSGVNDVMVLAGDGTRVLAVLPVGDAPYVLACSRQHRRLYVGHLNGGYVYVIRDSVSGILGPGDAAGRPRVLTAHPTPFRDRVTIELPGEPGNAVHAAVYSQDGRMVRRLWASPSAVERARLVWDGRTDAGRMTGPGVYFAKLEIRGGSRPEGDATATVRVVKSE